MNSDRTLEKIFNTKPEGVRSAGRPKLYGVYQDMKKREVDNWKRDEWTQLAKKAKAHRGLSIRC